MSIYRKLLKTIRQYIKVYDALLLEYNKWAEQLLPYETFIKSEMERKKEILNKKRMELFRDIFTKFPPAVISTLTNMTEQEQQNAILGFSDISSLTIIESFSNELIEMLKSPNTSSGDKFLISWKQKELIDYISSTRQQKYEEALVQYYRIRKDVIDVIKIANNIPDKQTDIYNIIKDKQICITNDTITNDKGEYIPVLFYTVQDWSKDF